MTYEEADHVMKAANLSRVKNGEGRDGAEPGKPWVVELDIAGTWLVVPYSDCETRAQAERLRLPLAGMCSLLSARFTDLMECET